VVVQRHDGVVMDRWIVRLRDRRSGDLTQASETKEKCHCGGWPHPLFIVFVLVGSGKRE
jgi:hypothetical protein